MTAATPAPADPKLGAHARRLMAKLAAGRQGKLLPDGSATVGTLRAPANLIDALLRADLIARDGDRIAISSPGRRWVIRMNQPRGSDTVHAQNRIEVRRKRDTPEGQRNVTVNLGDNPLAWLLRRKLISERQFMAGERLRLDHETAQRGPSMTMRWDAPPISRMPRGAPDAIDPTTAQIGARRRLETALEAAGPGLRDVLEQVVCLGHGIEAAERLLAWPPRSAKLVLGFALDRIGRSYGL